jgi:DNA-binding response OmpR family regulator
MILIVDDDPDIVEAMKVVLESRGYDVSTAASGAEGLKAIRRSKPALVILDVMMETGDEGFVVARKLRAAKETANIPVLMLTAIKDKTGVSFEKEAGNGTWLPVDDYVEKPLKPGELIAKVEELLGSL